MSGTTAEEIRQALVESIERLPMAARLYPDTWHMYDEDPVSAVLELLGEGNSLSRSNSSD